MMNTPRCGVPEVWKTEGHVSSGRHAGMLYYVLSLWALKPCIIRGGFRVCEGGGGGLQLITSPHRREGSNFGSNVKKPTSWAKQGGLQDPSVCAMDHTLAYRSCFSSCQFTVVIYRFNIRCIFFCCHKARWDRTTLTYRISRYTDDINPSKLNAIFARAFEVRRSLSLLAL